MPIKFPKGPFRRKSSGNVLDNVDDNTPATSSFRVLNREEVDSHAFESTTETKPSIGKRSISSPFGHKRASRSTDADAEIQDGRTNHSVSTTAGSSVHHSRDSTQPSSLSSVSQDDLSLYDKPSPALRPRSSTDQLKSALTANRGFMRRKKSYDMLSTSSPTNGPEPNIYDIPAPEPPAAILNVSSKRDSAMDDSENIFDGMPDRKSVYLCGDREVLSPLPMARVASNQNLLTANPYVPRTRSPSPSPRKAGAQPPQVVHRTNSWETDASRNGFRARASSPAPSFTPSNAADEPLLEEREPLSPGREDSPMLDALYASHMMEQRHGTPVSAHEEVYTSRSAIPTPPTQVRHPRVQLQDDHRKPISRPRQAPSSFRPVSSYDSPYSQVIENLPNSANRLSRLLPAGQKVMTPAEFKQYRERQERDIKDRVTMPQDEEEPSYEDEDDEFERKLQIAKQRKKQEAHLSVWRQQMRKVTGDSSAQTKMDASRSTPDLFAGLSSSTIDLQAKAGSDEDEDVPLGILQAHGFPTANRPPTKSSSAPPQAIAAYPAPAGTTRNDLAAGGGGSALPVFARGLPADPFIGANLVMPSNRQSLAFSNHVPIPGTQTRQPSPNRNRPPVYGHPGGLIGVIAEEERARAMRRQSSNMLGYQNMMQNQSFQQYATAQQAPLVYNPGMNASTMSLHQPLSGNTSPATVEQAQMMQLQMQWMQLQQMQMQMQGATPNASPSATAQPYNMPQAAQSEYFPSRPQSIAFGGPSQARPLHSRQASASSLLSFGQGMPSISMPARSATPTYTPSVAPSERSNIGQPSRYRPVSTFGMNDLAKQQILNNNPISQRQSRMYSSENANNSSGRLSVIDANRSNMPAKKLNKGKQPAYKAKMQEDEDDDEEGWAELKRKTQERKEKWRISRNLAAMMPGLGPVGGAETVVHGDEDMKGPSVKARDEQGKSNEKQEPGVPEGAYAYVS